MLHTNELNIKRLWSPWCVSIGGSFRPPRWNVLLHGGRGKANIDAFGVGNRGNVMFLVIFLTISLRESIFLLTFALAKENDDSSSRRADGQMPAHSQGHFFMSGEFYTYIRKYGGCHSVNFMSSSESIIFFCKRDVQPFFCPLRWWGTPALQKKMMDIWKRSGFRLQV